jgi:hypothetical protein
VGGDSISFKNHVNIVIFYTNIIVNSIKMCGRETHTTICPRYFLTLKHQRHTVTSFRTSICLFVPSLVCSFVRLFVHLFI